MPQFLLIAEFADKKIGFIIGIFEEENEARLLVDPVMKEFEAYSLNSLVEIPPYYYKKYQSYDFTGDEYFQSCKKYSDRYSSSNGDLTVNVIRFDGKFDFSAFLEYRNLPTYYGAMMN
jgi:hypothetical protein